MRGMPQWGAVRGHGPVLLRRTAGCLALALALALGGCSWGIQTPLPDLPKSKVSTSLSPQDRQKAVDDLARARDTHEQEAEKQIEQSR